jgi:hypothetical protein
MLNQHIVTLLYLVSVFFSFFLIGWLLNGYGASEIAWIGTGAMICYVIRVGSGAVVLASVWVVGLMSVVAINHHWLHHIPRPEFRFIPMILLVNWISALVVVWLLGKVSDFLRQNYASRVWAFSALISTVATGLASGWQLYPQTLQFLISTIV